MADIPGVVAVIAKAPQPGLVKTRLCPPLSPQDACEVAWACLLDTLDAAIAVPARRHVILLDGRPGDWIPAGFDVIPQRGNGLADRLTEGFRDINDHAVVIAMDTPQVAPSSLARALSGLSSGFDSAFGPCVDGGYWIIGLNEAVAPADVFEDIRMSTSSTGSAQLQRLRRLGLSTLILEELRDIDTFDDALAVADLATETRLATFMRALPYNSRNKSPGTGLAGASLR